MALRFRKSIKLAPGIRMNLSGSGLGWTLGPRGASVGIGKRGTFLNTGIPGTGLSSRQSLTGGGSTGSAVSSTRPQRPAPATVSMSLNVSVSDDGVISFTDSGGNPVSEAIVEVAKKQQGEAIKGIIQKTCDDINAQVEALGELHLQTPPPNKPPSYKSQTFDATRPVPPSPAVPGFFAKFFKSKVAAIETANANAEEDYQADLRQWNTKKSDFEAIERTKLDFVKKAVAGEPEAMERFIGEVLMDIVWPRETVVSFEFQEAGTYLAFDVDLPEVADMPNKTATAPQRGYKLTVKDIGPTNIQKLYAKHVHSIAFRLIGEAFGMLPTVQRVTLSGYSQRSSKATGHVEDEYLLSVNVPRADWERINFSKLDSLDVIEALARFDIKRDMTKTGIFKAIQPF